MPTTGTLGDAGTFTPDGDAPPQGPILNPYVDAGPFGEIVIGGFKLPGVIVSIDGCKKPEEWAIQKATKGSGATIVWKGTKTAESITITIALLTAAHYADYHAGRAVLRPKIGTKPPSLGVVNPTLNFQEITRIACRDYEPAKYVRSGGYWTGDVTVIEYDPSKDAKTGPAAPAKPGDYSNPEKSANDKLADELEKALKDAAA